ncbi:MAG: hypothetical protein QM796_07835 [Chthoniobacteraceae bacterium]
MLSAVIDNQDIPIRKAEAVNQPILQGEAYSLTLNGTPTQQDSFDNGTRSSLFGQNYDLAWQLKLADTVNITYDVSAGITQGSTTMLLTSQDFQYDTLGISNKINLGWQPVKIVTVDVFAQGGRTVNDGQSGFTTSQQIGADAAVQIWKDSKLGISGSIGDSTPYTQSLISQDTGSITFAQKLPWVPLTLNTSSSLTSQDAQETLAATATDGAAWKNSGSLSWAIQPEATWAIGLDDQQTTYQLNDIHERTTSYYSQFTLQPAQSWTTTFRISYDTHEKGPQDEMLSDQPAVNLSLGVNMKVSDTFGAGVMFHYRLPEVPMTTTGVVNDTLFTFTATALF